MYRADLPGPRQHFEEEGSLDCTWATEVLGARAETNETGGHLAQKRKRF